MTTAQKQEYFDQHPTVGVFHFTEKWAFFDRHLAEQEAKASGEWNGTAGEPGEPQTQTREEVAAQLAQETAPQAPATTENEDEIQAAGDATLGGTFSAPTATPDYSKWTKAQISDELTARNIDHDPNATKAALLELLTGTNE